MQEFLLSEECPNFIKADIEKAKAGHESNFQNDSDDEHVGDDNTEQPDWVDLSHAPILKITQILNMMMGGLTLIGL